MTINSSTNAPARGRILVSAFEYHPQTVSEGWTAYQLVAALRQRGRRMTVFTSRLPSMQRWYGIARVACRFSGHGTFILPHRYGEFSFRAFMLARRIREHCSVVHHVTPITLRVPSFWGALGLPFVWGPIGGSIPYPPGFEEYAAPNSVVNALRLLDRPRLHLDPTMLFTLMTADRIVATSTMTADLIPDRYRDKTIVIPEGLADTALLDAPAEEEPYIFSSGRLISYKAMDLLIKAFARVRNRGDVKLIVTGDGPLKPQLQALVERLGLGESVQLRGRVSREQNAQLMGRALFCVFPALREAFGHVNLEAMAAWKPVVVTDWGGPKDLVVDGVTGIKVLGSNPEDHSARLAEAMQRLIDDRELRRRMGAAARHRVAAEYSWSGLARRYDELYAQIV